MTVNRRGLVHRMTGVLLSNGCVPARLEFGFTSADPFAVTLGIRVGAVGGSSPPVVWVLARELLAQGLETASGDGDVLVRPLSAEWTTIELGGTVDGAIVIVASEDLLAFLEASFQVVADGAESGLLDWDAELRQLDAGA